MIAEPWVFDLNFDLYQLLLLLKFFLSFKVGVTLCQSSWSLGSPGIAPSVD